MTRLEIREAQLDRPGDARDVVRLTNAYASDPIGGGRPLASEVLDALVPGLRAHPATLVLLARIDGEAVGLATCFWGFSTFAARPLLNVHDLAVTPGHRGHGVGRALLRAVEERARARGCVKVTLEVREQNARARALYASQGFAHSGAGDALGPDLFYVKRL